VLVNWALLTNLEEEEAMARVRYMVSDVDEAVAFYVSLSDLN
jgi:hypothetical protein